MEGQKKVGRKSKIKSQSTIQNSEEQLQSLGRVLGIIIPAYIDGWNSLQLKKGSNQIATKVQFKTGPVLQIFFGS
jgi:hypothetical protein